MNRPTDWRILKIFSPGFRIKSEILTADLHTPIYPPPPHKEKRISRLEIKLWALKLKKKRTAEDKDASKIFIYFLFLLAGLCPRHSKPPV